MSHICGSKNSTAALPVLCLLLLVFTSCTNAVSSVEPQSGGGELDELSDTSWKNNLSATIQFAAGRKVTVDGGGRILSQGTYTISDTTVTLNLTSSTFDTRSETKAVLKRDASPQTLTISAEVVGVGTGLLPGMVFTRQ